MTRLHPAREAITPLALSCAMVVLCACLGHFVLAGVPHVMDAVAYHFQARVFASGSLTAPGTGLPRSFHVPTIIDTPASRYGIYPPGWPLLLGAGMVLGVPQLVDPLLAGLLVAFVWMAAADLFDRRAAAIAAALALLSPFVAFMGASYAAHMACASMLAGALAAALHATRDDSRNGLLWGAMAGACFGLAFLARPYSASLGLVGIAWTLVVSGRGRSLPRALAGAALPAAMALACYLAYNAATNGSPWRTGYQVYTPDFSFRGGHGIFRPTVWHNVALLIPTYLYYLSSEIWGGPFTDLLLLVAAMPVRDRRVQAVTVPGLLYVAGHSFYFYFDLCMGPRMAFEAMPWLLLASARGALELWQRTLPSRFARGLLALCGAAAVLIGPARFYPSQWRHYSANYFGQGRDLIEAVDARHLSHAVLLFRRGAFEALQCFYHRNAIPIDHSDVVYARYDETEIDRLDARFADRPLWVADVCYSPLPTRNTNQDRYRLDGVTFTLRRPDPHVQARRRAGRRFQDRARDGNEGHP